MTDGGSGSGGSGFDWGLRPSGEGIEPEAPETEEPEPAVPEAQAGQPQAPDPFSWPIAPASAASAPAAPEPAAPEPTAPETFAPWESSATQLMPQTEPSPFDTQLFAAEPPAPATELLGSAATAGGESGSALDDLFGETQFREYEAGVLDSQESPFAVRAARAEAVAAG